MSSRTWLGSLEQCGQGMVAAAEDLAFSFLACLSCSAAYVLLASDILAPS